MLIYQVVGLNGNCCVVRCSDAHVMFATNSVRSTLALTGAHALALSICLFGRLTVDMHCGKATCFLRSLSMNNWRSSAPSSLLSSSLVRLRRASWDRIVVVPAMGMLDRIFVVSAARLLGPDRCNADASTRSCTDGSILARTFPFKTRQHPSAPHAAGLNSGY